MAYKQITFRFDNSNEVSYIYDCPYGGNGSRSEKIHATPEQIKKQNQKNRENNIRRLIKANFNTEDMWITLKYPAGTKKSIKELKKDFKNFRERLKRRYKKLGAEPKYIYRMEIGKNGGLHIHILLNRPAGAQADVYIKEAWKEGHVWYTTLHEEGGYEKLAKYISKLPDEQIEGQLSLFPEEEREDLIRYGSSRNLIRPKPEIKEYSRRNVQRIIDDLNSGNYMKRATKGFYIDKDTIRTGINPVTGKAYLHYTEYRIRKWGDDVKKSKSIHSDLNKDSKTHRGKNKRNSGGNIRGGRNGSKVPTARKDRES